MSDFLWPYELQHTKLPSPSLSPRVCSKSYPLNQWCCLTISSLLPPSLPALNLSQHKDLFQWVSSSQQVAKASASVLPMNMQDWFPLGLPGLISCSPRDSQESSPTPQFKSINALVLKFLYRKKYLQGFFLVVDFFFSVKQSKVFSLHTLIWWSFCTIYTC